MNALTDADCGPRKNGQGWSARCPAHEDNNPSLSIGEGDEGQALLYCHVGCEVDAILAALRLTRADLFERRNGTGAGSRDVVATYIYRDATGQPYRRVQRTGDKQFFQSRWTGTSWAPKLNGQQGCLYRLPELLATPPDTAVWLTEGEKDADRLAGLGLVATTTAMGAKNWRKTDLAPLTGRTVLIPPDNDDEGRDSAKGKAAALTAAGSTVKVVELSGLPPHGDVSDYLNTHHLEDLLAVADTSPQWQPGDEIAASTVEYLDLVAIAAQGVPSPDWLVDGWLTSTDVALLAGGGGIGKTTTAAGLTLALAKGEPWCGVKVTRAVRVLFFDEEAGAAETARTMIRLGAPHPNLKVASEQAIRLDSEEGADRLAAEIETFDADVVVIDSVQQAFGSAKENDAGEIGAVYGRLFRLRARYGVTFVLLHHKKKAQGFQIDAIELVRGSSAHGTQASTVWCAAPGDGPGRLNIIVPKRRGASKPSLVISYQADGDNGPITLVGEGHVEDADTAFEKAVDWVLTYLADRDPQKTGDLRAAGEAAGHKVRTVTRALQHLKKLGRAEQPKRGVWALDRAFAAQPELPDTDGPNLAQTSPNDVSLGPNPTDERL